jgi:peroxiredoxin
MLGEAFNEGPRQRAYLMKGMANVSFPVTTKVKLAQRFFNQGVSQLHGFWYLEAERSFRQVHALDPNCAMAFWGMAMANVNNDKRAKEFIAKAAENREKASDRERMYIDAFAEYYGVKPGGGADRKARLRKLYKGLEAIFHKYPEDDEARAFLAVRMYENQWQVPIFSKHVLDAQLKQVLARNPMHPLHHYLIHLWDGQTAERALLSASRGGQSSPGIAHMWHMPGHIYSALQRYEDGCWQQEAGVRVDNAQLIRDRLLPDQIHNYAHNSEWFARNLSNVGRARDAVTLTKNMIDMPRHPKFNPRPQGYNTAGMGRQRLFEVLQRYEMWDEAMALCDSVTLEPTSIPAEQMRRLQLLAIACYATGDAARGDRELAVIEALAGPGKTAPSNHAKVVAEVRAYKAAYQGDRAEAEKQLAAANLPKERDASLRLRMGDLAKAEQLAQEAVNGKKNEVQPLALLVEVLHRAGKRDEAIQKLKELQTIAGSADRDAPVIQRVSALAPELAFSADWQLPSPQPKDVGKRPKLESLGPFRWTPTKALGWTLPDMNGKRISLADYQKKGRPVLVIFYLGVGCKGCMEQLNIFAPVTAEFEKAGISVVAVSTDTVEGLRKTLPDNKEQPAFPFPLVSDSSLRTFKAYRAYDDFEKMGLHGCYLIDADGYVRWQDIGFQPFKETKFLLEESKRLLSIPNPDQEKRLVRAAR